MTLADWITKYEAEAEKLIPLPGFQCHYEPDKGFFYWAVRGDVLEVDHTCTNDYKYFNKVANDMAKVRLCRLLRTATYHDPAVYMRFQRGAKVNLTFAGIRPNGRMYWVFERNVDYEREVV